MGIYYSSVGTRLQNILRFNELKIEDFAVIDPSLVVYLFHAGRKCVVALEEALEEMGMKPGKWRGNDEYRFGRAIGFYKEHREEIKKAHPIQYIEKPEPEKSKDDWSEYRKQLAKEIFLLYIKNEVDDPLNTPQVLSEAAVDAADALIEELKKEYQ